jgi:hypothetical protein
MRSTAKLASDRRRTKEPCLSIDFTPDDSRRRERPVRSAAPKIVMLNSSRYDLFHRSTHLLTKLGKGAIEARRPTIDVATFLMRNFEDLFIELVFALIRTTVDNRHAVGVEYASEAACISYGGGYKKFDCISMRRFGRIT